MAGLEGLARTPRVDARTRRNFSNLVFSADFVSGSTTIVLTDGIIEVQDLFLRNDGNDTTSGTITAAGFTTTGLGTFGNLDVDTLNFNDNVITDSTGTISFDTINLTTSGIVTTGEADIDGDLNHDGSNIGLFGTAPTSQQTVADQAAWAAISAGSDQVDLSDLNTKVQAIRDKLQDLIDALQAYGLVAAS